VLFPHRVRFSAKNAQQNENKILYRRHRPAVHMMNEFVYPSSLWSSLLEKIHLTNTFLTANILACKDTLNDRYGPLMPRHGMNMLRRLYLFMVYVTELSVC
jgi:hypothetical protein